MIRRINKMYDNNIWRLKGVFLAALILIFMTAATAGAIEVNITAGETTLSLPGAGGPISVPVWGFAHDLTQPAGTPPGDGVVKVPGNPIVVPPGDTTLTINLTNNLDEPVSLQILGQMLSPNNGPVWTDAAGGPPIIGSRPMGNFTARVRSFSHETAPGATVSYTWVDFKPGTYLVTSATNPAKQVQMGLYAAVKKDLAAGEAYAGVTYDKEIIMVYSEVDPLMQAAINDGTYGPTPDPVPAGWITSSIRREPTYFLINGVAFEPGGDLDPINGAEPFNAGDTVLIRFLNAGYETHVPQLLNMYMKLEAEDGNPYPHAREQYGYELAAGKTMDATIQMSSTLGRFSIHDAALHLTNAGGSGPGGMLAYVSTPPCEGDIEPVPPDRDVDGLDLFTLMQDFGQPCTPAGTCPGDIAPTGGNGVVDAADLNILAQAFGRANCP
jgi:FtsP/CotA-like multicopper oxidase with cupredoxin domain